MTKEMALKKNTPLAQPPIDFTPEQMQLITSVIAPTATPDELKLFLYRAKKLELDPLKPGQIYFIKYGGGPGSIVIGIEGFRAKAQRTGLLAGINRGVIKDDKGKLLGAWAEVRRKDWSHPTREEVSLSEYTTGRNTWATKPETMIKKVAEAAALRMAFPDDLGGVYIEEEFHREKETPVVAPQQPALVDGVQHQGYVMPSMAGRLAGKLLQFIPKEDLVAFIGVIDEKYKGKKIPPKTGEMHKIVCDRIVELEEGEQEPESFEKFEG